MELYIAHFCINLVSYRDITSVVYTESSVRKNDFITKIGIQIQSSFQSWKFLWFYWTLYFSFPIYYSSFLLLYFSGLVSEFQCLLYLDGCTMMMMMMMTRMRCVQRKNNFFDLFSFFLLPSLSILLVFTENWIARTLHILVLTQHYRYTYILSLKVEYRILQHGMLTVMLLAEQYNK